MTSRLPEFNLRGQTALVTGATGHLGKEMCRSLGHAGAHVLVNSKTFNSAQTFCIQLEAEGINCTPAVFSVNNAEQVQFFFDSRKEQPLNIIVNNAYTGTSGSVETATDEDYCDSYAISVVSSQRIIRLGLPALRLAYQEHKNASVINVSSMYASVSPKIEFYATRQNANPPFYGAAKAGLEQLTRYAACEFGEEGIRFNSIAPGPFPDISVQKKLPEFIETLAQQVPLKRIGYAHEIGGAILFLASHASSYVTGSCLHVDGGWTSW